MSENKKVAVVADDDQAILTLLEITYKGAGYEVHKATNGEEAVELLESLEADGVKVGLISTDFHMPDKEGKGVFYGDQVLMSSAARNTDAIKIIVTGRNDGLENDKGYKERTSGLKSQGDFKVDAVITKPFRPDEIINKIKEMEKSKAREVPVEAASTESPSLTELTSIAAQSAKSLDTKPKVLIVEQDDQARNFYEKLFKTDGYDVASSSNVEEANKLISKGQEFDLIIAGGLQSANPLGGADFLYKLDNETPKILVTGAGDQTERQKIQETFEKHDRNDVTVLSKLDQSQLVQTSREAKGHKGVGVGLAS